MNTIKHSLLVTVSAVAAFSLVTGGGAHAATLTWDSSGTSPASPVDGPGTWSTTAANWSNGTVDSAWNNSADSGATASFGSYALGAPSGTFTVTLGSNITAGGLVSNATYKNSGYKIVGSGGYGLTLTGPSVAVNSPLTISANTIFQQGLNVTAPSGGQNLTLSGTNTNTVGTTVAAGAFLNVFPNSANLVAALGTAPVAVSSGGTLVFNGGGNISNNITSVGGGGYTPDIGGAVRFYGNNVVYNDNGTFSVPDSGYGIQMAVAGSGSTVNLNGAISDVSGSSGNRNDLIITGVAGVNRNPASNQAIHINFNAAETYTNATQLESYGTTTVYTLNGGADTLPAETQLNLTSSNWNGSVSPLVLNLDGNNQHIAGLVTYSQYQYFSPGSVTIEDSTGNGATLTITGDALANTTSTLGTVKYAQANYNIVRLGGGELNLLTNVSDTSSTEGVYISANSTINLASGVTFSVPLNIWLTGDGTSDATINLNGGTLASNAITGGGGVATLNLNGTLAMTGTSPAQADWVSPGVTLNVLSSGVTLDVASGLDGDVASPFLQGPNGSTGGVTITGGGTVTMNGANTYAGPTTIEAGTLASSGTIKGTSALTIASGATLNLSNTDAGNGVVIDYGSGASPNSAIQQYVASGAITTSAGYAVGYADGADGVVSGLSAGQEKIMATLPGDTNLAGTVNLGDVSTVYNNVGITSGATWDQGDFTASGSVTLGDLTSTYNNVGLSLATGPTITPGTSQGSNSTPLASGLSQSLVASAAASTTPAVTDVTLTVNKATGDAILVFNNASAQFYAWEITSKTGGLNYANLTDLPNFGTGLHARGPTALDGVYSGFATGGFYNPGGTWNLGDIITPSDITSGALDFSFNEFNPSSGLSVTFDPGTINYTAVPEPASLALLAIGALAMLTLTGKRRKA
jgi:autotransporter-associated beta strand protein